MPVRRAPADRWGGGLLVPMQKAAQRMAPIEPARRGGTGLTQMVLPKFVGEQKGNDQQRQHEKRP